MQHGLRRARHLRERVEIGKPAWANEKHDRMGRWDEVTARSLRKAARAVSQVSIYALRYGITWQKITPSKHAVSNFATARKGCGLLSNR
jgi:uncharacterized protein YaeQ